MKTKPLFLVPLLLAFTAGTGFSVTTNWVGNGNPALWSDPLNWSAGVPTATSIANLVYPAGDVLDIAITSNASAQGIIFGNDLTYPNQIYTIGATTLTLGSAGITNLWGAGMTYEAATIIGASCTITSGAGLTLNQTLTIGTNTLTVAPGGVLLQIAGPTTFAVDSLSAYGQIDGSGPVQLTGALRFNFTSATGPGTWDFINQSPSGSLSSVSLTGSYSGGLTNSAGTWTGTYGGLNWTYTTSTGVLTAVPEPSTGAFLALGLTSVAAFRRRQHRK